VTTHENQINWQDTEDSCNPLTYDVFQRILRIYTSCLDAEWCGLHLKYAPLLCYDRVTLADDGTLVHRPRELGMGRKTIHVHHHNWEMWSGC
jgi:hypothetical protein